MQAFLESIPGRLVHEPELLVLAILFCGVALLVVGLTTALGPPDIIERRLEFTTAGRGGQARLALRVYGDNLPQTLLARVIAPTDPAERVKLRYRLLRAGFGSGQALVNYYLIRAIMGVALPMPLFIWAFILSLRPNGLDAPFPLLGITVGSTMTLACVMLLVGFYGPSFWLQRRARGRQQAIAEGFPHALDMLQVAIEGGLGFDSALARIATELRHAHPALAEEFAVVGLELRAGKSRDQVLTNLAERTGVDAISTFCTVIIHSMSFGTSVSAALQSFAREMRHKRMMTAEEKANQLPVKMSFVMVILMLPTLFLVALSPVIIRLVRLFTSDLFAGQ